MPRRSRKHPEPYSLWINAPLQNIIKGELERRDWRPADLARAIGSQPSLVSRWMMGQRPNPESIALIADALGVDAYRLMVAAGHIPAQADEDEHADPRLLNLIAKLRQVELDDVRYEVLDLLVEAFRQKPLIARVADQTRLIA